MMQAQRSVSADESRMSRAVFEKVAGLAYSQAGIVLSESKLSMMESRLRKRLVKLDIPSFETYCNFLESDDGKSEVRELISSLTTNVSHFFREEHHFDQLGKQALPKLIEKVRNGGKARIWSAGCSNGQEPYSIAMTVLETAPELTRADFKILATDIDYQVLETAKAGLYNDRMTNGLSKERMATFGHRTADGWQVAPEVKRLIAFRHLNLIDRWPMRGVFDVVFCRNVVIYFDAKTQASLWQRFCDILVPGGLVFAGHSERISGPAQSVLRPSGLTAYHKPELGTETKHHAKGAESWG